MKKTKVFLTVISILFSVVLIGGLVMGVALIAEYPEPENDAVIFDNYYIYRDSSTNCTIYEKDKYNEEHDYYDDHNIIQGWIYKYSYDKDKKVIALRHIWAYNLNETYNEMGDVIYYRYHGFEKFAVTEDILKLYDCKTNRFIDFESDEELSQFCENNGINLSNWYYPAGNGFFEETQIQIAGNYYLKTWLDYSSIVLGEKELVFGYISDVKVDGDLISFRLRQTKNEYSPEHIEANEGLSPLSEKSVGKYKIDFFTYNDVYYDKIVTININTGEIKEK